MSWTDEEIDNLFRDGANGQSFEYDNAYFSEIESALPVNGKGKDFLWMGTALLFIAVLTTGYLVNNANDTSFNANNDQLANVELNTANDNTTNTNASNESEISIVDQNEPSNNGEVNELNTEFSNLENSSSNTKVQPLVDPNSMRSIANRNVGGARTKTLKQPNDECQLADANGTQNQTTEGSTNKNLTDLVNDAKANDQKELNLESGAITAALDLNGANQLDQGLTKSLAPNAMPIGLGQIRPKAALYFELNAGVSQSLITPSDLVSKSIGGGIGVETYLGDFNLNTGLNFKTSYHDELYLTRTGKVYGFGSNEGENEYDVEKVYSIEMPITLGYNFGRHNFNLGVRPSLVVSTGTQFYSYEDGVALRSGFLNGFIVEEAENEAEEIDVVKRFGLKPTIGYSYRINNWTIGANVGVQLMQSIDENLFDLTNNQLPVDGQIYLRRTIRLRK